jgi:hypothetical protein
MAYVYLGNLTTKQLTERLGIALTIDEIEKLEEKRTDNAQEIPEGKWHCFDAPFSIQVGDYDTAQFLADILGPYGSEMKTSIQIGIKQ